MKILVCIKQVLNTESTLSIRPDGLWAETTDDSDYRMNRFDDYALEEALLIKEAVSEVTVDALSLGPGRAADVLKRALAKGADNAIHLLQEDSGFIQPLDVSRQISAYAKSQSYDLILTGVMAEDDMLCQVGPMTAALLRLPCAVSVTRQDLHLENHTITAHCELEGGRTEEILLPLPAVLTIQSGINRPRYPSLSNMLRANRQEPTIISTSRSSTEMQISLRYPPKTLQAVMLEGSATEKATQLLAIFQRKALLNQV